MLFNQIEQLKSTLSSERAEALSQFLAAGFPTKKDEEYKYTRPVRSREQAIFSDAEAGIFTLQKSS